MPYNKTQIKRKKLGEYKLRQSRNRQAIIINKLMDKMMFEAINRDKS